MKKKVCFEHWVDPLNNNLPEVEWPGFNQDEDGNEVAIHSIKPQQVMHTPFGMLTTIQSTMASSQFDFWLMHTNFDITNEVCDIVKRIPGVETLEIQTRYRARLGFPKTAFFASNKTMHDIQVAITNMDRDKQNQLLIGLTNKVANDVIVMRDNIDNTYDTWALYVLPNGRVEVVVVTSGGVDKTYQQKLQLFHKTQSLVGGRLLTSEV